MPGYSSKQIYEKLGPLWVFLTLSFLVVCFYSLPLFRRFWAPILSDICPPLFPIIVQVVFICCLAEKILRKVVFPPLLRHEGARASLRRLLGTVDPEDIVACVCVVLLFVPTQSDMRIAAEDIAKQQNILIPKREVEALSTADQKTLNELVQKAEHMYEQQWNVLDAICGEGKASDLNPYDKKLFEQVKAQTVSPEEMKHWDKLIKDKQIKDKEAEENARSRD